MWNPLENYEKQALANIEYSKHMYETQVAKVQQEEYIKQLILADYVKNIKAHISRYDTLENIFRSAQSEIGKKLKKERFHLETLKDFMREDFLDNDKEFKLTEIVCNGFEGYSYSMCFEGYGKTIKISIPVMKNITADNVGHAKYGMFVFAVKTSECGWDILAKSYEMEDIAKSIKEYFADATK